MWGMGIKGRINVGLLFIGIRSAFGIAYKKLRKALREHKFS